MVDTIVLSCMDPRLNSYLDKKYLDNKKYGEVEIWRNASGRMMPSEKIIKYIKDAGVKRVILAPHTDCKARKHMYEAIKHHAENRGDVIVDQAAGLMKGHAFANRNEFDRLLSEAEENFFKEELEKVGVKVELEVIDISKIDVQKSNAEHMLIICDNPHISSARIAMEAGVDLPAAYIIQGPDLRIMNPDINLALDLGIKKVNIITEEQRSR